MHVLTDNRRYAWKVTPIVRGEVKHADTRMALERAILEGRIDLAEIGTDSETEIALWGKWSQQLDAGEAEAVVLAISRNWLVAIEDRKGQRVLSSELGPGRWINCANLLLDAVAEGRLSIAEADDIFRKLSCYPGYQRRGISSLRDLLK
jgi:predicted nucleic acid-binding protein